MTGSPFHRTRLVRSLLQLRQTVPQPPAFALRQTVEFDLLRGDARAALCGENMTMRVSQVAPTVALTLALLAGLAACGKGPQGDQGPPGPQGPQGRCRSDRSSGASRSCGAAG